MHIPIYSIGMVLFPFKLKGYVMEVMCISTTYPVELAARMPSVHEISNTSYSARMYSVQQGAWTLPMHTAAAVAVNIAVPPPLVDTLGVTVAVSVTMHVSKQVLSKQVSKYVST